MQKRKIPRTTLCCIDCQLPELALQALLHSMALCTFERVLFFTDRIVDIPGIECVPIRKLTSTADYSAFVLHRLADFIETDFALLIQWDGFVLNTAAWRDQFFDVDYIGALWPHRGDNWRVGNGGFSLRSKKLLKLCQRIDIFHPDHSVLNVGEDELLCTAYRTTLETEFGIRFATEELAQAFSFERTHPASLPFGFHGLFNFWAVLPPQHVEKLVAALPDALARGKHYLELSVKYLEIRQFSIAGAMLARILQLEPEHIQARKYAAALPGPRSAPNLARNDACLCGSGQRYKACCGKDIAGADPARAHDLLAMYKMAQILKTQGRLVYAASLLRLLLNERPEHAPAMRDLEELIEKIQQVSI